MKLPSHLEKIFDKLKDSAWLGLDEGEEKRLFNPLETFPPQAKDEPHVYITFLLSRPEYFYGFCKYILNIELLPIQCVVLKELWKRKLPMLIAHRGFSKSFLLAIHALLRMIFMPGRRVVITGAAFRQSKIIFEYMEQIWKGAPMLKDMLGIREKPFTHSNDLYRFTIYDSVTSALPLGTGDKVRGQRAHDVVSDEFGSIVVDIFENVIAGFTAVSSNPVEKVKIESAQRVMKERYNIDLLAYGEDDYYMSNQIVISGTADYDFKHFAKYWKKWKAIVESGGDPSKLSENLSEEDLKGNFNWKDYSVIRIPVELTPQGFLDEGQVARSKATMETGIYMHEFGACFSSDSAGFFRRSLLEGCTISPDNVIKDSRGDPIDFEVKLEGNPNRGYVIGVDPASERDNFAIIVLELHHDHRRIVYSWTTTKRSYKEEVNQGITQDTDYYGYCARKIRDLKQKFPCERIAIDTQGGGYAILEALQDKDKLKTGESPILPIINPDKPEPTDKLMGEHIIELIQFANPQWTSDAHHNTKKDFEDKVLIFPYYDPLSISLAGHRDELESRIHDSMEEATLEIEELKDELSLIVHTQTAQGRDKFDMPEIKSTHGRKGRLKKDRASALVMANETARSLQRSPKRGPRVASGGFAGQRYKKDNIKEPMYHGNPRFNSWAESVYGR